MGALFIKKGVDFGTSLAPAGARILDYLKRRVPLYSFDLTITSARDGTHSGPSDPHHSGEAFDLRTHGLLDPQKRQVLSDLRLLGPRFFAFLEAADTPNEHVHVQRAKDTVYSILDYLNNA